MATLVTGLGYIGSALAERLLAEGEAVVGIENFFSTPREPIGGLVKRGLKLVEGSVANLKAVERAFEVGPIDTVFHFAAQASAAPEAATVAYTQETNYTGPRVLLDACVAHGVGRFVFASSMRLYRTPLPRRVSEQSPVGPTDLVHLSHLYGETLLAAYRPRGVIGVAARLGIVHGVGPVMKTDSRFLAVPQRFCLQAAHGEPLVASTGATAIHAFVHMEDAIAALVALRRAPSDLRTTNVACEARSVADVARAVQAAAGARGIEVRVRYQGRPRPTAPRVIESAAGFKPRRRIEDGVAETLDHYLGVGGRGSVRVAAERLRTPQSRGVG